MTKMKSKKMTKSTFAIIIMGIVMVAMLAFGGTFAYFTAKSNSETSSKLTTGYVHLTSNGAITSINVENVMPTQTILEADAAKLTVTTSETTGNYVAIKFTITATDKNGTAISAEDLASAGLSADSIVATTGEGWYKIKDGQYVYGTNATTAVAKTGEVVINSNAFIFNAEDVWDQSKSGTSGYISENNLMEANITITMQAFSIQSTGVLETEAVTKLVALLNPTQD